MTLRQRYIVGLQAAGIFSLMCILWAYWSCQSWAEFQALIDAASRPTLREVMILRRAGDYLHLRNDLGKVEPRNVRRPWDTGKPTPFRFWLSAIAVTAGSVCLLAVPSVATWSIPASKGFIARLHNDVLNARDMDQQRRGDDEDLDVNRADNWGSHNAEEPEGWSKGKKSFYREGVRTFW